MQYKSSKFINNYLIQNDKIVLICIHFNDNNYYITTNDYEVIHNFILNKKNIFLKNILDINPDVILLQDVDDDYVMDIPGY